MAVNGLINQSEIEHFPRELSEQEIKTFATSSATTMYTVPAGKVFYIIFASIEGRGEGGSNVAVPTITAGGDVIASMAYQRAGSEVSSGTFDDVIGWTPTIKNFPVPIKLVAGDTIVTALDGLGSDQIYFLVNGWEE